MNKIEAAAMPAEADKDLIDRFAVALQTKMAETRAKGRSGWEHPGWMDECRVALARHIEKGDPRDVALYCAFLWYHGERTTPPPSEDAQSIAENMLGCYCGGVGRHAGDCAAIYRPMVATALIAAEQRGMMRAAEWHDKQAAEALAAADEARAKGWHWSVAGLDAKALTHALSATALRAEAGKCSIALAERIEQRVWEKAAEIVQELANSAEEHEGIAALEEAAEGFRAEAAKLGGGK